MIRTGWVWGYALAGLGAVLLYGAAEWRGWASAPDGRAQIAPNVRQSPGGWRSWTFWHSGLHGGK